MEYQSIKKKQVVTSPLRHCALIQDALKELEDMLDPFYEEVLEENLPSKRVLIDRCLIMFSLIHDMRHYLFSEKERTVTGVQVI